MRSIVLLILATFSFSTFSQVQSAKEVAVNMSKGKQQGWKILIPIADNKLVQKEWGKLMKAYDSKTSKVKKHDEYISETARIPSLSEREIIVYAQFDETPEGVYLIAFYDLGGAYLNSNMHKDLVKPLQDLMQKFATEVAIEAIEDKLSEEEKALKKLEDEQKRLKSDEESYEKDIKDCEARIDQRKSDLETNRTEQQKKETEVSEQQSKVEEVKALRKQFK